MADCIICAYKIDGTERIRALTKCGHEEPICSICFLRIRSLQRNFHCPSCKQELDSIICCDDPRAQFGSFQIWGDNIGEDFVYDQLSQMFFPKDYYRTRIDVLRQIKCTICPATRRDFKGLKGHLNSEHNLHLCLLCVEHKHVFPSEQRVYTKSEYDRHLKCGDNDGSIGHPNCEFCRTRFYDTTALFMHLNKEHYTCFLCEQQGIKFKYFHQYGHLQEHFRKDHFLCEEASCLERRFVAFGNEIDLRSHCISYHPHLSINRTIPLQFKVRRASDQAEVDLDRLESTGAVEAQGDGTAARAQYEGGLGGRASHGIWQVELAPTSSDPRDPDRNASMPSMPPTAETEEFPALPTSGLGSLVNNRWISAPAKAPSGSAKVKPATTYGRPHVGTNRAGDFPALPVSDTVKKTTARSNTGAKKVAQLLEIQKEYASLSSGVDLPAPAPRDNIFGGWSANVRVDKRLGKKHGTTTAAVKAPAASTNWGGGGMVDAGDVYEAELEAALHESLELFTLVKNPANPDRLEDQQAYPSLAPTTSSSEKAPPAARVSTKSAGGTKAVKPAAPKKPIAAVSNDWSQALKAVGMDVPKKKKKNTGLTVLKADDPAADFKLKANPKK